MATHRASTGTRSAPATASHAPRPRAGVRPEATRIAPRALARVVCRIAARARGSWRRVGIGVLIAEARERSIPPATEREVRRDLACEWSCRTSARRDRTDRGLESLT